VKTEHLIDFLARGETPAERVSFARRLALTLAGGFAAATLLLIVFLGMRPDIGVALDSVLMKAGFSALAAAIVLPLAARLMRPGAPLGWRLAAIGLFIGVCALVVVIALMGEAPETRMRAWMGDGFPWCLVLVPLLAAPTAAGLVWLMRAFAPTRLTLSGAALGALSGGIGAMAYSMYCPVDSIAFVTTWYVAAIALCAALGALLGGKLLRW
jgi:hypothetical protein